MSTLLEAPTRRLQMPRLAVHACRFCTAPLRLPFVDLGVTPLCQRHVAPADYFRMEPTYPLKAYVCQECRLVQLPDHATPAEIFSDYAFFSGFSSTWLQHVEDYAQAMTGRFGLSPDSFVVEVASNDGTLLKPFQQRGVKVRGIEPAANVAVAAVAAGVPTTVAFLDRRSAVAFTKKHGQADLVAANNVLAHTPNLVGFVEGLKQLLKPAGVLTVEFPHLANLIRLNQFDTIYHEHWSYFWFTTVRRVFAELGLTVFDVQRVSTHGGSLRVFACRSDAAAHPPRQSVREMLAEERADGIDDDTTYTAFAARVQESKRRLVSLLLELSENGSRVCAYGAPGKGNTLLNYCGIGPDLVHFTVDRNPQKQGNYLPGSRIPILAPEAIEQYRPDYVLVLPWNLADEIMHQLDYVRSWGGRFILPIPEVHIR